MDGPVLTAENLLLVQGSHMENTAQSRQVCWGAEEGKHHKNVSKWKTALSGSELDFSSLSKKNQLSAGQIEKKMPPISIIHPLTLKLGSKQGKE